MKTRATLPLDLEGKPHIRNSPRNLPSDCLSIFTVLLSSVLSCWKWGQTSFVNKYHHLQKLSQKNFPEIPSTSFAKNWQINALLKYNTIIKGCFMQCYILFCKRLVFDEILCRLVGVKPEQTRWVTSWHPNVFSKERVRHSPNQSAPWYLVS